jgi:hypothetical protein
MALPEPLAGLDISQRQDEEHKGENDHQKVEHGKAPSPDCLQAERKLCGELPKRLFPP